MELRDKLLPVLAKHTHSPLSDMPWEQGDDGLDALLDELAAIYTAATQAAAERGEAWIDAKTLPPILTPVLARLEWPSGKVVYSVLKRVDEDDCTWRTVDDGSEIVYDVHVTHWQPITELTGPGESDTIPSKTENNSA